ncbi:MAG: divalent metal cation transporter [Myxococcota bacterium]
MRVFGPGLIFAAAAVGVSHLVQSTRAGARFGLGLLALVVLANLVKYPAFRFGAQYAVGTGHSLLEGYRRRGRPAIFLYGALTVATMFTVQAAVTAVTAGLAMATFGLSNLVLTSAVILGICCALLILGSYEGLDRTVKLLVAAFSICTVLTTLMVLPSVDFGTILQWPAATSENLFFMAAVFGWMPSAIDVAAWQSLWTLERMRRDGAASLLLDFDVGYFGTAALAVCFLCLGAGLVYGQGARLPDSAAGFSAAFVDLYAQTLGPWSRPVIGTAALTVMLSTTLTVLDGFPRAFAATVPLMGGGPSPSLEGAHASEARIRGLTIVGLALGALVVIGTLAQSLRALVDLATTLSFLTAPVLSMLNHWAVTGPEVDPRYRPGPGLLTWSRLAILLQAVFALAWILLRFGGGG